LKPLVFNDPVTSALNGFSAALFDGCWDPIDGPLHAVSPRDTTAAAAIQRKLALVIFDLSFYSIGGPAPTGICTVSWAASLRLWDRFHNPCYRVEMTSGSWQCGPAEKKPDAEGLMNTPVRRILATVASAALVST
jgi:hypothetical protein